MPRLIRTWALPVSEFNATLKCRECEVFIGTGHEDQAPIPAPEGTGYFCRSCLESWNRRQRVGRYVRVDWQTV
jgi:hypothetical protein